MTASQPSELAHNMRTSAHSSSGSFELVLSAVIFGLVGYGLDYLFGTRPVFVTAMVILGFGGAAISLYYRYRYQMDRLAAERIDRHAAERTSTQNAPGAEVAR